MSDIYFPLSSACDVFNDYPCSLHICESPYQSLPLPSPRPHYRSSPCRTVLSQTLPPRYRRGIRISDNQNIICPRGSLYDPRISANEDIIVPYTRSMYSPRMSNFNAVLEEFNSDDKIADEFIADDKVCIDIHDDVNERDVGNGEFNSKTAREEFFGFI